MKSLLFNSYMLEAFKAGKKTTTMRLIKPQPPVNATLQTVQGSIFTWALSGDAETGWIAAPHCIGDTLCIPESWRSAVKQPSGELIYAIEFKDGERIEFKLEDTERAEKWEKYRHKDLSKWQSPYFMPREAARTFARIIDITLIRPKDLTEEQIVAEGVQYTDFVACQLSWQVNADGGKTFQLAIPSQNAGWYYKTVEDPSECHFTAKEAYMSLWDSTVKKEDCWLYGYDANPYAWMLQLEKLTWEEVAR